MDNPFIGMIAVFGFDFAPQDWQYAAGQSLPVNQYQALFALLGARYGGSGVVDFQLPNLKGRTMIGQGTSSEGINFQIAEFGGSAKTTLTEAQMPAHTHGATFTPGGAGSAVKVEVSRSAAGKTTPDTGDYLGVVSLGRDQYSAYVDKNNPGTTVALGGVTGGGGAGGTVTIGTTGGSKAFTTISPFLVLNPCIATNGLWPPRQN